MMETIEKQTSTLERFGFSFEKGGAHIARTMMLAELRDLVSYIADSNATKADYIRAIEDENCLHKRSGIARKLTTRHLVDLYSLDPFVTLFRTLTYFWSRDPDGQPLLALLCAFSRDAVLRMSAPFILALQNGTVITRIDMERYIEEQTHGRFSAATLKSTAKNLNGTWTQSGHMIGKVRKVRAAALATPGSISYALLLGYLTGVRGGALFQTDYIKLLDCGPEQAIDLAETASRRGWIVFKRIGDVKEVLFPALLTSQELEWLREQN